MRSKIIYESYVCSITFCFTKHLIMQVQDKISHLLPCLNKDCARRKARNGHSRMASSKDKIALFILFAFYHDQLNFFTLLPSDYVQAMPFIPSIHVKHLKGCNMCNLTIPKLKNKNFFTIHLLNSLYPN